MSSVPAPEKCAICGGGEFSLLFHYEAPPLLETKFSFAAEGEYLREVYACCTCGHCMSVHTMDEGALYSEEYVSATYGDGLRRAFEKVINLDPAKSDNVGRVQRIVEFAHNWRAANGERAGGEMPSALDVGSGLCVFLHRLQQFGWRCTALDPDARAVQHAREVVGVDAICGDFMNAKTPGRYDLISFNKVLEHVPDPIAMLTRSHAYLAEGGLVYIEVPDAECSAVDGPDREEYCIDHPHIFSFGSLALLAAKAGFSVRRMERLKEPSTKYTLFAFLAAAPLEP